MREYEDPISTPDPSPGMPDAVKETHPCYAMIGASRVSGYSPLFQSDFYHQHYMTVRIYGAEVNRDLNRDMVHPSSLRPYIEVAMTEAQWATFVSTPNGGMGIPCTLTSRDGKMIPGLNKPKDRDAQFKDEVKEDAKQALEALNKLSTLIDSMPLSGKKKEELQSALFQATRKLTDAIPFVEKSFAEHVEKTMEQAKVEIHAHAMNVITGLGLQALAEKMPFVLEGGGNDTRGTRLIAGDRQEASRPAEGE